MGTVITGGVRSGVGGGGGVIVTLTTKLALALFPAAVLGAAASRSSAPAGTSHPDAGAHTTGTAPSTASTAVTEKVTAAPDGRLLERRLFPAREVRGQRVGDGHREGLRCAVSALCLWRCRSLSSVPSGNVEPDAGVQFGVTAPSTASVAVTAYDVTVPAGPIADTVSGPGRLITGGVVSCTVTVNARLCGVAVRVGGRACDGRGSDREGRAGGRQAADGDGGAASVGRGRALGRSRLHRTSSWPRR